MRKLKHEEIPRLRNAEGAHHTRHPVCVLVNNVRSVHNAGAFFRTSDGAWIRHIYLCGITPTPEHRGIHKTALGAQDTVPWSHHANALDVIRGLRNEGYAIAALELTSAPRLTDSLQENDFPLCLVIGNEIEGIEEHVLEQCDFALEIPQYGLKQSLNVSVALGVALFDIVKRYRNIQHLPLLHDPFHRPR